MRISSPRTPLKLKTEVVKKRVIGGDTDYCLDAFSFTPDENGLASSYAVIAREKKQSAANVFRATYLPRYNFSILLNEGHFLVRVKNGVYDKLASYGTMYSASTFMVDYIKEGVAHYAFVGKHVFAELSDNDSRKSIEIPYWIKCGVLWKNRLIGADGLNALIVRWSANLCDDWTAGASGSGYVYLEPDGGKVMGAAVYNDDIVFVRERGITLMHALGDPRNFSVEPTIMLNTTSPALLNSTCTALGKVWFFSKDKMYVYDGKVSEVPLAKFVKGFEFVRAQSYDERYIYAYCTKGEVSQFLEYDALTGTCTFFGRGLMAFWRTPGEDCAINKHYISDMRKDVPDENRFWLSEEFGSENPRVKNLKAVEIDCDDAIEVAVIVDGGEACTLKGGKHNLFLHGVSFAFKVRGVGRIRTLDAEWEVTE